MSASARTSNVTPEDVTTTTRIRGVSLFASTLRIRHEVKVCLKMHTFPFVFTWSFISLILGGDRGLVGELRREEVRESGDGDRERDDDARDVLRVSRERQTDSR